MSESLYELQLELNAARETIAMLRAKLKNDICSDSIVGSCNCLTKSGEAKHHARGCKYRLLDERNELRTCVDNLASDVITEFGHQSWRLQHYYRLPHVLERKKYAII